MDAKSRNAFIADMPKKQMIKYAAENEHLEDTFTKSEKMHKRYQELASKFDFEAYIPLIPTFGFFCSVTLEDIVPQNIGHFLPSKFKHMHYFTPDAILEEELFISRNLDWECDRLAQMLFEYGIWREVH